MISIIIIDYFKIILITLPLFYTFFLLIRRDLQEGPPVEPEVDSSEAKPETEVVYYESLSLVEKYKKLIDEFNKIKQLLPCNEKLNNFRECLTEISKLKHKVDRMYHAELVQFNNALTWLEKPLVTRGKYKPTKVYDEDIDGFTMETIDKAIQLIDKNEKCNNKGFPEKSTVNITTDDNSFSRTLDTEKITEIPIPAKINLLKIPDINLKKILEVKVVFERLWTLAKIWSYKLAFNVSESIKIWFVVLMILRDSIFTLETMSKALVLLGALLNKCIIIQVEANKRDDTTNITLIIFPSPETEKIQRKGLYKILDLWDWITHK